MAKVHQRVDRHGQVWHVTALCDKKLLGKVLKEGDVTLDLDKYRSFYEGMQVTENEAIGLLQGSRNVNAVGPNAVACARKALNIDTKQVKKVQGIPHLHIYYL
ncbi:DUF424 domain-containing protein [Candidatus Micrarchaeota archaeon]|nr:DUF424 domain-containing protein [Candidatus Micrarchaeota archaeon]